MIQTAFLGDVVLTTPLLAALAREAGPVDVVTTPAAAPLLATHPAVGRLWTFDKRRADRGMRGLLRLAEQLRGAGYRRVILAHRSWRSALLALTAGIPERVGYADAPGSATYTERRPGPVGGHAVDRLLALGPGGDAPPVSLALTDADRQEAARWLAVAGVTGPFVAVAPGSIWGTKRWPGYPALAAALDLPVVAIGGSDDAALAQAVVAAAPGRAHNAAGALSLRGSAALIECAQVLVTNDSAPLHLAGAVGTRTVAIFGPTVPAFGFGPRGPRDVVVEHPALPCRPCSHHGPMTCPLGHHRCMRELSVEKVLRAVRGER